jgi:hypothetical protein
MPALFFISLESAGQAAMQTSFVLEIKNFGRGVKNMAADWRQHTEISTDRLQPAPVEGDEARRGERGEVLAAIADSVARQQREIELQQNLVAQALQSCPRSGGFSALAANCPLRSREKRLRAAILQAIDVLEASRKAFKSKQLEALRKNLTAVLIETG